MTSATTGSRTVLLVGGFAPGQSQWSIQQGFEAAGYRVVYVPSRGCIAANSEADAALAKEEADLIPPPEQWDLCYPNNAAYEEGLAKLIEQHQPELLLWWFSKDDCPAGLITNLRNRFGWLKTATHTQDDPWDALRHPEFSQEFEFVVTCCKESVSVYRDRGLRAIVLYPPPARQLHATATPAPHETCDFSVTILSIYARGDSDGSAYLSSADPVERITHPIGFPDQRVLRHEVVATVAALGRTHVYGGLGFGTFEGIPRSCYRGFRTYAELPGIYQAAKININQHNSPQSHGYLNQRDTAITGSGGFMLTDYVEGIEEEFDIGTEIDTWASVDELRDKAQWWLRHDDKRRAAGQAAQRRVLDRYGNDAYVERLMTFIQTQEAS
ncbi:MAG: glycosyltransferase family 1 protein [Gemmatimonadetes bacterium]|jgi:hypothetical protein|nr:glycosyltransferase family 1 protein [Gemmatimonadota bacterium]MBT5059523.1 glycosyltransferase family 1 protein [Gemmatimonadota bacterium]MBT5144293.1 glycosyltransferase family 1 protein [Gemmatimonadota bacterium]MBT5590041.1 glycosyltransferase family 1 protein [Gemmatimonadota bacterium]MBT5960101.1 glycosyltransferase family 1 protein [Gemmatimonadota bacterium]